MNFKDYKKLAEDKKSATFQHPKGHQIIIAKHVLSEKMRKQIESLPKYMYGGGQSDHSDLASYDPADEVPGATTTQPTSQPAGQPPQAQPTIINITNGQQPQAPAPNYVHNGTFDMNKFVQDSPSAPISSKIGAMKQEDAQGALAAEQQMNALKQQHDQAVQYNQLAASRGLPTIAVPEMPMAPQANAPVVPAALATNNAAQGSMPQEPSDPYGTQAYLDNYSKGLNEQKSGLYGEAQALGQQGNAQAQALQQGVSAQQKMMADYQNTLSALTQEHQHFIQDVQNQKIDPNHYMNSLGTMGKTRLAMGLIIGGMGSGLTHQENPAMKILNQNIERDVQAQMANLGKSENLLSANMKQFGNMRDATQMTFAMQSGIVSDQLKQAAAATQDPLAKARALQAAGQLDAQAAPILGQIAMRKTLMNGMQQGHMDPSSVVRMVVPEGQQAAAYKELQAAENMSKQKDNLLGAFDTLNSENTLANRVTSPIQTSKQVNAIREPLLAQLVKDAEGRITPQDVEMIRSLFPAPGDNAQTTQVKRNQMNKFISEKMNFPMLQSYGINVANSGRFGSNGQKKIQMGAPVAQ